MPLPTITNDDPAPIMVKVADMDIGDGFLWDGGKIYQKLSATKTYGHENGAINDVADFGDVLAPKRTINVHHKAAVV
jgi:hypothetical protein